MVITDCDDTKWIPSKKLKQVVWLFHFLYLDQWAMISDLQLIQERQCILSISMKYSI